MSALFYVVFLSVKYKTETDLTEKGKELFGGCWEAHGVPGEAVEPCRMVGSQDSS